MAPRGRGFVKEPGHDAELQGHIFEVVSQLAGQSNISLRALRETLQQRMGVDLAGRRAEIRCLAELSLEVLMSNRCDRLEGDRGRMLFTQLHDAVCITACCHGTWEPLANINGWWHDSRARNTCCNQTGDGCWELFCLERRLQLDEHLLSDKTVCGGDGSGYPLLERSLLGYGKNSKSCDMEGTTSATFNGRIDTFLLLYPACRHRCGMTES